MDRYVTGEMIRALREKARMTQAELAEKICVSDKTVSKWETGRGYPDVTLLEPLAAALNVSAAELLAGSAVTNGNVSADMLRAGFCVCPVCGNIVCCVGGAAVHCHGVALTPAEAEAPDAKHAATAERVEDEWFVQVEHEMTKRHYISFIAALSSDRVQLVKLYPEGSASARFRMDGVKRLCWYCNQDGLYGAELKDLLG